MNTDQKAHLLQHLASGKRYDGRSLLEWRPIKIEVDVSKSAEGSARVIVGRTDIMAGVKLGCEKPYPDTPEQGNLMINAELYPLSSPNFEPGPPNEQSIEMARVIDRGIREAKCINVKDLCQKAGEKVWSVSVDVVTINDDGDLMDAGAIAAMAALRTARFPALKDGVVDYGERTTTPLPLKNNPIAITVYMIDKYFVIDPLPEEEEAMDARLTITVTEDGLIRAMQKGGATPLTAEQIDSMVGIAADKAPELRKILISATGGK